MKKLLQWYRGFRNMKRIRRLSKRNGIHVDRGDAHRLKIRIKGEGNVIEIPKLLGSGVIRIDICGDGNRIVFGRNVHVDRSLAISIGQDHPNFGKSNRSHVTIGDRCMFLGVDMAMYTSNSGIEIGDDTGISYDTHLYHTDAHPVYLIDDLTRPINHVGTMVLGKHVWVGGQATLLKNCRIGDDCIVGWGSVVSGKFPDPNCVLGGNPARIVKRGVTWKLHDPKYTENAAPLRGDG